MQRNAINPKLLKYLVHEMIFEFHAIIQQYVSRAYMDWKAVIYEHGSYGIC